MQGECSWGQWQSWGGSHSGKGGGGSGAVVPRERGKAMAASVLAPRRGVWQIWKGRRKCGMVSIIGT